MMKNEISRIDQLGKAVKREEKLEDLLIVVSRFGKPRLSNMGDGWLCVCDMYLSQDGCSFEVKSEFDHPSPLEAATICAKRILSALESLG